MSKAVDIEIGRQPPILKGFSLLALSFQTLGIIYSDIGTSPLYVLNGIWPADGPAPSKEDVIGGISCIIWALTLIPLLKYVLVALRFGSVEGEGGCFALYHGLLPPAHVTAEEDRLLTGETYKTGSAYRKKSNLSRFKWVLLPWALFGTSLTMADGIFTPAVSVTSAVGGIAVAVPSVSTHITPISIAFLFVLFAIQRFGTARLSFAFSPITMAWFLLLAATGVVNITKFPGIFRAFDPSRAVAAFIRTKNFDLLAGVLLAVTGCEALFANLGQFNKLSIQLSFTFITYPVLLLAYLGQGARLIVDGEDVLSNVFYNTIPGSTKGPLFWIIYVFAILATLVASQAMITATFSLVQQLMNMKSFPLLRMIYTSDSVQGQVYIPAANWSLAIATLVVVGVFKNLVTLTNAYGFAVATVMFVTTTLIAIQSHYVKHWPILASGALFLFFGFFDGLLFGAALKKVPLGAWVPLTIGFFLLTLMVFWTWARGLEEEFDGVNRKNLRHFIIPVDGGEEAGPKAEVVSSDESQEIEKNDHEAALNSRVVPRTLHLADDTGHPSGQVAVLPIMAIFYKFGSGKGIPHAFVGFLRQYPALPRVVIFLSIRILSIAHVNPENRFVVDKVRSIDGFYGVTYQLGFKDEFDVDVNAIIDDICNIEERARIGIDPPELVDATWEIREAARRTTHMQVYVHCPSASSGHQHLSSSVPHYNVVSKHVRFSQNFKLVNYAVNLVRRGLIELIYRRLSIIFPETANWLTPADEIIHVGVTARI
ncbi:potassium transporter-domain-containing protein [Hysterangium stoloniferum]|nr:potassium transporter-domain-containing protein [Hysterangium stoloniferum]